MNQIGEQPIYKLYIDEKWYIPVDSQGYCVGLCYEGALGVVVQLRNDKGGVYALKIPRLLADTLKENSYICELLNEEERNVNEIFTTQDEIGRDGLLRGALLKDKIIQAPIQSSNSIYEEARVQNGQIIAVQYNKGKMPRFVGLKTQENGEISVYPESIERVELPIKNTEDFNKLSENAIENGSPWKKTIVLYEPRDNRKKVAYIDIIDFLKEQGPVEKLWYVGLPSIVYEWGNSTLSEVIINRKNEGWNLLEYLQVTKTLLSGLNSLHHRNVIHSDIRPANIMHIGSSDNPLNYKLIDYGSFNRHDFGIDKDHKVDKGNHDKILGPTLSKERISPFYAPERRADIEKENADTAVFLSEEKDNVRILLGWRSDLLDGEHIKEEIIEGLRTFEFPSIKEGKPTYDPALLIPGDKIQVREYIFQIEDVSMDAHGNRVLLCSREYWKIFHGKIITSAKEEIESGTWMSIPRTKELRQWSFATDIYGIGAIFFYLLFWGGTDEADQKLAEIEFSEMLSELDSVPFFKNMWVDLAPLCAQIEEFYEKDIDKKEIDSFVFNPEDYLALSKEVRKEDIQKKSFLEYAKYITFLLTYSVKGTRKILKLLNYNYIYFIYAMHFGLCAIHRRVSLFNDDDNNEIMTEETMVKNRKNIVYPFCKSRVNNRIDKNDAVSKAGNYLETFVKILNSKKFKTFKLGEAERERNNPQHIPATELRRRFVELNDKHNLLETRMDSIKGIRDELEKEKELLSKKMEDAVGENDKTLKQNQKLNVILKEKSESISNLENRIKELSKNLSDKENRLKNVEKDHNDASEKLKNYDEMSAEVKKSIYEMVGNAKKKFGFGYPDELIDDIMLLINNFKSKN